MNQRKPDPLWSALQYIISPIFFICYLSAYFGLVLLVITSAFLVLTFVFLYVKFRILAKDNRDTDERTIAFFHPYCDAGGGGERVLWCGIRAIQKRFPAERLVIFTGDVNSAPDQILEKAQKRFNINLKDIDKLEFIYLHRRKWVEADMYPRFTLLGQSIGSIYLALEALEKCRPDVFIDTMGYAFTLPIFKYFGKCKVGCYVHYPTISTDMLDKVRSRAKSFNNKRGIANSKLATNLKLIYYNIFAKLYGKAGECSDLTMVNSSWTEDHITQLWRKRGQLVHKIYPPCDVKVFKEIERESSEDDFDHKSDIKIVSIGQFRPEKDHALQIRAMFELRMLIPDNQWQKIKLILIGGCRNAEDEKRVQDLKDLCKHMSVEENVEFRLNIPFQDLCEAMKTASIGLHTMWNEHFGIAVVEMLAAGLVTIAHRSGGPLMDIVADEACGRNGFLAIHDKEYAAMISYILNLNPEGRQAIRDRARSSVSRFSDHEFEIKWGSATEALINSC